MDYEKVYIKLIQIFAEQEEIKVEINIERGWKQMKKTRKNKLYEFIGKATVRITTWAMSVYLVYQASLYILDNCITVYR